ncbi:MAG: hypothetical protein JWQ42_2360 [Edaphobacter sp.]|nr:hypothetical protein [Edaphobacter sp.]
MRDLTKITRRSFTRNLAASGLYFSLPKESQSLYSDSPTIAIQPSGITYLVSYGARITPGLHVKRVPGHQGGKHFWVEGWNDTQQLFEWSVVAKHAGDYEVTLMISAPAGSLINLEGPRNRLQCTTTESEKGHYNWDRITLASPLKLPQGISTIRIRLAHSIATPTIGGAFKALELLNIHERPAMNARIKAFRSDASWLSGAKFGFMCQCGEWAYPPEGSKKTWPQFADDFDVEKFAELVESTGAGYAIWSATWATYYFPAPIRAIESLLPGHTSRRDLIGEIANALAKRRIPLILYYHLGAEGPVSSVTTPSLNPLTFAQQSNFYDNWCSILQEVGERYGDRLAGWMFDDELIYYPAPYEKLGEAAKAGNKSRIISYNPWMQARGTDFQDFQFGEGFTGSSELPVSAKGIWPSGPFKDLQSHGCFQMDGPDWGINNPDTQIQAPHFTTERAVKRALDAAERDEALSWNLLMYDDGSVSPKSLALLREVGRAIRKQ